MTDEERLAELWPHVDGWPDSPALATATREEIEDYAGTRLAAQCMLDAELGVMPTAWHSTPEEAWEWGQRQWAQTKRCTDG